MHMSPSLDVLLDRLEAAKSRFGRDAAAESKLLLDQISHSRFSDAKSLIRFHEALLFMRAFPQSASLVPRIEKLLNTFRERIEKLRELDSDMSAFDDFDTSGIAGTTMQDALSFEAARWLARRIPRNVEIAWDDYSADYESERTMGSAWPRFIPLLSEDADIEANIPWRQWLNAARGRQRDFEWLIRRFEELPATNRERAELYDSLRLPLRWRLGNLKFSRTRTWIRPRQFYYHSEPLIVRSQVSLARELAQPAPNLEKLSRREGESVLNTIREVMVVRYRELYGATLGDPGSVVRCELGRGVVIYFWNLEVDRRLPLRAYVAGFALKNGVPISYIEASGLCEWLEVGFNTFYTYRQGETAWVYARALRCLCAFTGATTISVYPYQIGQNNEEGIDSGAFWFYRKLGFRSGSGELEQLARREEGKIAANPQYRTLKRTLKRLAEAHMFYELPGSKGFAWDTFSTRNLGLRVNRRMAREFEGNSARIRSVSVDVVKRALNINPSRWTSEERQAFENWSLVLAMISDLRGWSWQEKHDMVRIIRAQASPHEMRYVRLTQKHPRLREELLRLGSRA
jgi:hypothetical protein